jgi:hypothetical protein
MPLIIAIYASFWKNLPLIAWKKEKLINSESYNKEGNKA